MPNPPISFGRVTIGYATKQWPPLLLSFLSTCISALFYHWLCAPNEVCKSRARLYVWEAKADISSYIVKEETDPEKMLTRGTQITLYLRVRNWTHVL
jgi:hypothetical protein